MFNGYLPWSNLKSKNKADLHSKIHSAKTNCTTETLCNNLPREFFVFFNYIKVMDFDEKPPYKSFKKMFEKLLLNYTEVPFEWML